MWTEYNSKVSGAKQSLPQKKSLLNRFCHNFDVRPAHDSPMMTEEEGKKNIYPPPPPPPPL